MMSRRGRRNDQGVTEVIGYVLSFALSAMFLLIALNVFYTARENTDAVVTGVELKAIANRIAGRVVEAGLISQEFENATFDLVLAIPQSLQGKPYTIIGADAEIIAETDDGALTASATTFKLDAIEEVDVSGIVRSSNERVRVHYEKVGLRYEITLSGD